MSLPKRIYELWREITNCDLVISQVPTTENMVEFQNLLNRSTPMDANEQAHRELVRCMYYSNPVGFMRYISVYRNRVQPLVLWTESKRIAKLFNLTGHIHISWNESTGQYVVMRHIPRQFRSNEQNSPVRLKLMYDDLDEQEPQKTKVKKIKMRTPRNVAFKDNETKDNTSSTMSNVCPSLAQPTITIKKPYVHPSTPIPSPRKNPTLLHVHEQNWADMHD